MPNSTGSMAKVILVVMISSFNFVFIIGQKIFDELLRITRKASPSSPLVSRGRAH
jgi:hypothetical protein